MSSIAELWDQDFDELYKRNKLFRQYHEIIRDQMIEINQRYRIVNWKHSDSAFLNFVLYLSGIRRNVRLVCTRYLNKNNQHDEWAFKLLMYQLYNRTESVENAMHSRRRVLKRNMKNKNRLESLCDHFESTNID
jgi:hypothetical protein